MKIICYKRCSTCKKAIKFLEKSNNNFEQIDYTENPLSFTEIKNLWKKSGLPIKKFFNTSGNLYKEFDMKNRLEKMSEDEKLEILSKNPMLIKRPILVFKNEVLVGFNEEEWRKVL